jgi:predicted amidohydrolase
VVAGSFHEDDSGAAEGSGPRRNVAHAFDGHGDEVLRQVKLRPMRAMPGDQVADEEIEGGSSVRLIHAWFGLLGIAICLDFCEIGDSPVTDLWRAIGPALMLVPSMGADPTNNAHREKARPLARQHGTAVVVASQHPLENAALGLSWDSGSGAHQDSPVLHGALRWTKT